MHFINIRRNRFVHIIFIWFISILFGMLFVYHFRSDFLPFIQKNAFRPVSMFAVLIFSFVPLILSVLFIGFQRFFLLYLILSLKAFLYGFAFLFYALCGIRSGFLLFSQSISCILFVLFSFISLEPRKLSFQNTAYIFLTANFILILIDYFIVCPLYS